MKNETLDPMKMTTEALKMTSDTLIKGYQYLTNPVDIATAKALIHRRVLSLGSTPEEKRLHVLPGPQAESVAAAYPAHAYKWLAINCVKFSVAERGFAVRYVTDGKNEETLMTAAQSPDMEWFVESLPDAPFEVMLKARGKDKDGTVWKGRPVLRCGTTTELTMAMASTKLASGCLNIKDEFHKLYRDSVK